MTDRTSELGTAPAADDPRRPLNLGGGLFALFLAALWGGNPVAIKAGLDDSPPLRLGWLRFVIGGIVVLAWAVWTRRPLDVARHERKPLFYLGCLFAIQLAFMNIGQDFTTAGHAVVITDYVSALDQRASALLCARGPAVEGSGLPGRWWRMRRVVVLFSRAIGNPGDFLLGDFLLARVGHLARRQAGVYLSNSSQRNRTAKVAHVAVGGRDCDVCGGKPDAGTRPIQLDRPGSSLALMRIRAW